MRSKKCGITVLISHHEPLVRAGLQTAMQAYGEVADCVTADGSSFDEVDLPSFDVAITDCDFGLKLARLDKAQRPPVLIVTNDSSEASIRTAMEAGANGYLLLDASLEAVARAVSCVIRGGTALDPVATTKMLHILKSERLTDREREVMSLLMEGSSDKAIAKELGIALGTVKCHLKHLMGKLNARSRTHAVVIAQTRGIVRALSPP